MYAAVVSVSPTSRRDAVPFAPALAAHGGRVALIDGDRAVTYEELAVAVDAVAARLGPTRRLVQVGAANRLDAVVAYLGALAGGHVVLLSEDGGAHTAALAARYAPDVVLGAGPDGVSLEERRPGTAHDLHPDLALLLSTSGSTGSAKLVRLSRTNLAANATSIADYLGLTADDRAITSLPLHYCYGLSVLHSHLAVGAGVILTETSVVDPCFWEAFRTGGATSFAGVPYTFELLDRAGFADMELPRLRYVTQAGGRLAPDQVRRYARLGAERGWDLYVMYGQTEATARMAYLPPHLAEAHPDAIGVPIPGGRFEIDGTTHDATTHDGAVEDDAVGELLYRGPNVMMGYATGPADLSEGPGVDVLRTGDLARRGDDGLIRIVGRRSRFLKLFGVRVDLDVVERRLAHEGVEALCTGDDTRLIVGTTRDDAAGTRRLVRDLTGLPAGAVQVLTMEALPRTANGKPDHGTVRALADIESTGSDPHRDGSPRTDAPTRRVDAGRHGWWRRAATPAAATGGNAEATDPSAEVRAAAAEILDIDDPSDADTFVTLGGDSLSYVEMSVRLEEILGHVPPGWHLMPLGDLGREARPRGRWTTWMETGVLLRAVAIVLVVGTHAALFELRGGAHVLLAVAGYNFARFQLRSGQLARSIARVAVPTVTWIATLFVLTDDYGPANLVLANNLVGDDLWGPRWHFWYVEALVQILVVVGAVLAVPAVRRFHDRHPSALPLGLFAASVVPVVGIAGIADTSRHLARPHLVVWLFLAGWAAERAGSTWPRLAITAGATAAAVGFFGDPRRDAAVIIGVALLVWVPSIPVPRALQRPIGAVAAASLYIYLVHWQVYRGVRDAWGAGAALLVSLLVGILAYRLAQRITPTIARAVSRTWRRRGSGAAASAGAARRGSDGQRSDGERGLLSSRR